MTFKILSGGPKTNNFQFIAGLAPGFFSTATYAIPEDKKILTATSIRRSRRHTIQRSASTSALGGADTARSATPESAIP
jgi:hypothetical protein